MAKNLNLQMTVTADTSQAKREMQSLQDQLSKLNSSLDFGKGFGTGFTKDMQKTKAEIAGLQVALKNATNVDTGKLDFTKFNQQLKISGQTLNGYAVTLNSLGTEGQQAFLNLTKAVASSEVPLRRVSNTMKEMGNTLTNTLRWQISSSVLHGFIGALQTAYGYAKDLNESLNNIRIVTSLDTQAMAQFAEQANTAAQALSTSTLNYTDAALIYYQQGLSDEEVRKRTETTIKLANVTKDSAEEVSSQMTAIWNNFAKGSENLEIYADKITALGAATASSSAEIAQGLEKFAAVANTVGLSYDYATSALATVVAQTRQSADIVGTAFKTLFARLESLNLEGSFTDEEGTTVSLNKYSKALEQVGINIFQANGQLKDMDEILDDMGAKWQTLDKNSQVALAQTVGGMRQYNQLIALMDNYDFFKQNLSIVQGAEGTLQQQQDIYAESWEASTKRVKAAWESLYNDIIKDNFFITLNDELAKFLGNLDKFIDNLGGLKGLLITMAPLILNMFGDKLQAGIQNTVNNIQMMIPGFREAQISQRNAMVKEGLNAARSLYGQNSIEYKEYDKTVNYQRIMAQYGEQLTKEQKDQLALMHDQEMKALELQKTRQKDLENLQEQNKILTKNTQELINQRDYYIPSYGEDTKKTLNKFTGRVAISTMLDTDISEFVGEQGEGNWQNMASRAEAALNWARNNKDQQSIESNTIKALEDLTEEWYELKENAKKLEKELEESSISEDEYQKALQGLKERRFTTAKNQNLLVEDFNKEINETKVRDEISDQEQLDEKERIRELKKETEAEFSRVFKGKGNVKISAGLGESNLKEAEKFIKNLDTSTVANLKNQEYYLKKLKEIKDKIKEVERAETEVEETAEERSKKMVQAAEQEGLNLGEQIRKQADIDTANNTLNSSAIPITAKQMEEATARVNALSNSVMGLTTGVASLASGITQAQAVGQAWNQVLEGNMTVTQALLQSVTNLGFAIPNLVSGATKLKEGFLALQNIQKADIAIQVKKATAMTLLSNLKEKDVIIERLEAMGMEKTIALKLADKIATDGLTAANLGEIASNTSLITSLKFLATSYHSVAFAAGVAVAAIAAAAYVISKYQQEIAEVQEAQKENEERRKTLQEERKVNQQILEQIDNLQKLSKEVKVGTTTKEDYNKALIEVAESLEIENVKLYEQAGAYEYLTKKIREAEKEKASEVESSLMSESGLLRGNLDSEKIENDSNSIWFNSILGVYDKILAFDSALTGNPLVASAIGSSREQLANEVQQAPQYRGSSEDEELLNALEKNISKYGLERIAEVTADGGLSIDWTSATDAQALKMIRVLQELTEDFDYLDSALLNNIKTQIDLDQTEKTFTANLSDQLATSQLYDEDFQNRVNKFSNLSDIDKFIGQVEISDTNAGYTQDTVRSGLITAVRGNDNALGMAYSMLDEFASKYSLNVSDLIKYFDKLSLSEEELPKVIDAFVTADDKAAMFFKQGEDDFESFIEVIRSGLDSLTSGAQDTLQALSSIHSALEELKLNKTFYNIDELDKFAKKLGLTGEELLKIYPEAFDKFSDGSYKFKGDINLLYNTLFNNKFNEIQTQRKEKENEIGSLEKQLSERASILGLDIKSDELGHQSVSGDDINKLLSEEEGNVFSSTFGEDSPLKGKIELINVLIEKINTFKKELEETDFTFDDYVNPGTNIEELQHLRETIKGTAEDYEKHLVSAALESASVMQNGAEAVQTQAEYLQENNKYLQDAAEYTYEVALANKLFNNGLQDLANNIDTWDDSLKNATKDSEKYIEAISGIEKDLQQVFSTDENISRDFILEHLEDIKKAAKGDMDSIHKLQVAYAKMQTDVSQMGSQAGLQNFLTSTGTSIDELQNKIEKIKWENIEIGASLDVDPALQALQQLIVSSKMSVKQATEILNSFGYVANFQKENVNIAGQDVEVVSAITSAYYTGANKFIPKTKSSSKKKGSGKSRSKKDQKELKDEFERYYTISRQLQDQIDLLDKLGKVKDRAWGKAKLEYIEKETKALEDELTIQEKYLKEIQNYYKEDQKNLNFFGAKYDENGVVTNYDEMIKKELDRYNAAVKKYNAGGSEAAFSKAEQRYEDFKKKLKQYDDTNELYQKKLEEIQELQYQIYDKELEKITTKVEMDIQVNDAELKKLEYDLDRIQKKAFATAEAIAKLSDQLSVNLDSQSSYQEGLENILANHGINSIDEISGLSEDEIANLGFTEDEVNTLLDYNDSLIDMQNTIDELQETIMHGMVDAFEEWNKEFDYQQDKIATNIDLLKQYQDIADLIYSNASGVTDEFITNLMESQYAQMVNGVDAAYNRLDVQKKALEEARAEYENLIASGASEQTLTAFRNDLREMEAEVEKSQSDMLKKTEEALKQAEDIFKNAVENMTKIYQQMTHTTDWDMTQFDRLKKLDDEYLDDYEKIYELSKLTRDVNNSIDDMDTIRAKERLKEITQEIADIEASGKEVSQYEVDALRKKYELRLAEIALEDAQAAKQTVRMSRDNDGNWSYIYTADNDNVDKARQNYEDKLYEYQKLNSEFIKEQQENFLKLEQEYVDAMTKIAEDSSLNQEDKENRLRETQEYYQRMADIMSDQLGIALNRNSELYTKDWLDYSKNTGYKISKEEEYQTKLQNTYTGVLQPNIESATELLAQFTEATVGDDGFFPAIISALDEFNTKQDEVLNAAGTSLEDYSKLVSNVMKETAQGSQDAADTVRVSAEEMKDAFDQVIAKIKELNGKKLDGLRSDVDTTVNAVNKLISTYKQLSNAIDSYNNKQNNSGVNSATYKPSPSNSSSTGSGTGQKVSATPINTAQKSGGIGKNSLNTTQLNNLANILMAIGLDQSPSSIQAMSRVASGTSTTKTLIGSNLSGNNLINRLKQFTDKDISTIRENLNSKQGSSYSSLLKKYGSFDTGGYTGAWGTEGRLAMLHQKELVLNAHDTENMLNTIQMVRDIVASIDTRAAAASVANISAGYAGATAGGPQTLDQNVHIEANFPNVTDHNEIELAITGLVNRASQYVGRKKL